MFEKVADRILELLTIRGMKQIDLARACNLSANAITNYKKKDRIPETQALFSIAQVLNTSMEWLLTGEGEMSPHHAVDASFPLSDIWKLKDYQKEALNQHLNMLTEEQAALINNYEKLTLHDKKEIRAIIKMKLLEYELNPNVSEDVAGL